MGATPPCVNDALGRGIEPREDSKTKSSSILFVYQPKNRHLISISGQRCGDDNSADLGS